MIGNIRANLRGYQRAVASWIRRMPEPESMRWSDTEERALRFLEESVELVQAEGLTKERALRVLDYVFSRPVGETRQEVGGVSVTLAVYCEMKGIDLHSCALNELDRVNRPDIMQKIASKQAMKRAAGMTSDSIGGDVVSG